MSELLNQTILDLLDFEDPTSKGPIANVAFYSDDGVVFLKCPVVQYQYDSSDLFSPKIAVFQQSRDIICNPYLVLP